MKKLTKPIQIPDLTTGEFVALEKATPAQVSAYLTELDKKTKQIKQVVDAIKKFAIDKVQFEDDGSGRMTATYGEHRVMQMYRYAFSQKLLEKNGTPEDKALWENLKAKYSQLTNFIKWG